MASDGAAERGGPLEHLVAVDAGDPAELGGAVEVVEDAGAEPVCSPFAQRLQEGCGAADNGAEVWEGLRARGGGLEGERLVEHVGDEEEALDALAAEVVEEAGCIEAGA